MTTNIQSWNTESSIDEGCLVSLASFGGVGNLARVNRRYLHALISIPKSLWGLKASPPCIAGIWNFEGGKRNTFLASQWEKVDGISQYRVFRAKRKALSI